MTSCDHASVCADMRIGDGTLWPIPITLDVGDALADTLPAGDRLALRAPEGVTLCARTCRRNWVLARGTATSTSGASATSRRRSMPWARVEKSLTRNRKNDRLPTEVMPSDRRSARSSGVRVRGATARAGRSSIDSEPEVVGSQRERAGVDDEPPRGVERLLGPERPAALQPRGLEGRRNGGALDELEGLGVDGGLHVERVLLPRRGDPEPGADTVAHRDRVVQRVAERELPVGRVAEQVEVLDAGGGAGGPPDVEPLQLEVAVSGDVLRVQTPAV